MRAEGNRALELLLSDGDINGKEARDIFYQFVRDWRENAPEPQDAIFDIAVQLFQPENKNVDGLERKIQRDLILSAIEQKEVDEQMDEYMRQLAELEEQSASTQGNLNQTSATYSQFSEGVRNNSQPEFRLRVLKGEPDANGNPRPDTLAWSIYDPLVGFSDRDKIEKLDMTEEYIASVENGLKTDYMAKRPTLIAARKVALEQKIKRLDKKDRAITSDKQTAGTRQKNYAEYKNTRVGIHENTQSRRIYHMRENLRKKYGEKEIEK